MYILTFFLLETVITEINHCHHGLYNTTAKLIENASYTQDD